MTIRFLAAASMLTLASCGGNLVPVAASLTPAILSPETIATLNVWCARGQPLLDIARGQNLSPAAREIAAHVGPYCAALAGGSLPSTTDMNTTAWLPANIVGLSQALGLSLR